MITKLIESSAEFALEKIAKWIKERKIKHGDEILAVLKKHWEEFLTEFTTEIEKMNNEIEKELKLMTDEITRMEDDLATLECYAPNSNSEQFNKMLETKKKSIEKMKERVNLKKGEKIN